MLKYFSLILFVLFIALGCSILIPANDTFSQKKKVQKDEKALYQQAIENSIYPTLAEIDSNLVTIDGSNPNLIWKTINNEKYVLVVTWKQNISYYQDKINSVYNTGNFPIWVTTAPELKNRFTKENSNDTNLRLIQLLGLPPNATYSYFVEFWVKPSDLFRPCPDKEINDKKCDICFPTNTDSVHKNWINENRASRYYDCELYNQYPWTQLGYTYDWNPKNKTHVGLSEFVIGANKSIFVNAIYSTSEYLKK